MVTAVVSEGRILAALVNDLALSGIQALVVVAGARGRARAKARARARMRAGAGLELMKVRERTGGQGFAYPAGSMAM